MEVLNCIITVPLGSIALFFLFIGWRRGIRFNFYDYQGNKTERLRDNFLSSFTVITSLCSVFPIFAPTSLWGFIIPFSLLMVLVLTPLAMLGAYFSSFLAHLPTRGSVFNVGFWGQKNIEGSKLQWYEFTPFAFVIGWMVYYLVYVLSLLASGMKIMSDTVPMWIILVALMFGVITAVFLTIGIHRKFEKV